MLRLSSLTSESYCRSFGGLYSGAAPVSALIFFISSRFSTKSVKFFILSIEGAEKHFHDSLNQAFFLILYYILLYVKCEEEVLSPLLALYLRRKRRLVLPSKNVLSPSVYSPSASVVFFFVCGGTSSCYYSPFSSKRQR